MSRREASLMAYVTAEEQLLNRYSPLEGDEVDTEASEAPGDASGVAEYRECPTDIVTSVTRSSRTGADLDPAVDSMLHVISDDSDVQSLISSGSGFKGWPEEQPSSSFVPQSEPLIFGLRRQMMMTEETHQAPAWATCTPAKRSYSSHEVIEVNDSPESVQDPAIGLMQTVVSSPGMLLTNGNVDQFEMLSHENDEGEHELQVAEEEEQCVIYESVDGENMVVLGEEHCCEIIVATQGVPCEQEFARAIMMAGNGAGALLGLLPEESDANECLNGTAYIEEVVEDMGVAEARLAAGNNVYLSDAALEQPLAHQELVDDEAPEENENATFLDDTPMEEERPDICQVYDHELEDHDDEECEDAVQEEQAQPIEIIEFEGQEPLPNNPQRKLLREHSSPTEFPVSSSSMPNASDHYDYEDELTGGRPPSKVAPLKRKYPPLMKNTLHGEAMDRRLASICQAQPQLSPAEKVSNWETAPREEWADVEDVEGFEAAFKQYEAVTASLKQLNFAEFRETLVRNMEKISREIMQTSDESTQELASSQSAERPVYRRFLHILPTEETIVLDDDDDDCYEVVGMEKASVTTLIPEEELQDDQQPEEEEIVLADVDDLKNTDSPNFEQRNLTKETSTADLESSALTQTACSSAANLDLVASVSYTKPRPTAPAGLADFMQANLSDRGPSEEQQLTNAVLNVMRQQVQTMQQQQFMEQKMNQQPQMYHYEELPQAPQQMQMEGNQGPYVNYPNEQQEFCNYLGLTELSTANAVATAMRELANSTIARRSLRVRPQQQLDRMRSDVRGKRRERERDRQQDKDKKIPLTTSSELSTDKEEPSPPQTSQSVSRMAGDADVHFNSQLPAEHKRKLNHLYNSYFAEEEDCSTKRSPKTTDFLASSKSSKDVEGQTSHKGPEPQRRRSIVDGDGYHKHEIDKESDKGRVQSVEAAFTKIFEAAAPAQSKLLESMQQRLRQARETKPSIYIIKATSNASPPNPSHSRQESHISPAPSHLIGGFGDVSAPHPSVISQPVKKSVTITSPAKDTLQSPVPLPVDTPKKPKHRKTHGATKPVAATPRRRTTMGASSPGKEARARDLVTRSTTHLNSKLLRSRKVSLLKSYALSDEMAQGRSKRIAGGAAQNTKKALMPKAARTSLKKPQPVDKSLPEHRLQQQQLAPPNSPRKMKGVKETETATTSSRLSKRTKRARAKSLPSNIETVTEPVAAVPNATVLRLADVPNTFAPTHSHLVNSAAKEAADNTFVHSPSVVQSPYAQPVLIYPPSPTTPPPNTELHRPRQQAGKVNPADLVRATPPGGLLRLSQGSATLANPLSAKHGQVLYIGMAGMVIYTTIADSRYFVMAWQQELVMGKSRSGICKYSLTPTLDTLASIREFKQLRHELRHIECLSEDRLIGYGQMRITVWDHRSGDTLMNYDLGRPLGRCLAAMHYPSLDMDQSSMLVLYQLLKEPNKPAEVHVIACELSHATPSHRLLQVHRLPSPQFDDATEGVNTGDHLIIKSASNDEAWISAADPRQLTYLAPQSNGAQRFYARHKSQVIEMSPQSLTVDSIANHMLKLAVQQTQSA
ncbi:GM25801 [Drosophila sechellia]|uniref:GM25801 n=1 Tax=Drosophila sechellia TaxID=7238 RepID=B4IEG5_DROSE|nr:GM25801 [Drosophila sechellia]